MVNHHGDRKSPKWVVGPLPNGLNGLYMGVTNYLLTGMILQVLFEDKTHPKFTLPETSSKFAPETRPFAPKGNSSEPIIHFQGRTFSFREGTHLVFLVCCLKKTNTIYMSRLPFAHVFCFEQV